MDHFGIGAAVKGVVQTYFRTARGTGRTTSLIESVKDGDRVVFLTKQDAQRTERLFRDRGVVVECVIIPVDQPDRVFERGTPKGRTIFDHRWVEEFYTSAIDRAASAIDHFERQSSGYGEAHREARRQAEEAKYRPIPNF